MLPCMVHVLSFEGAYSMLAAGDISSVYETKQVCSRALGSGGAVEGMHSQNKNTNYWNTSISKASLPAGRQRDVSFLTVTI